MTTAPGALLVIAGTALFGTVGTARVLGPDDASSFAVAFARLLVSALVMVGLGRVIARRHRRRAAAPGAGSRVAAALLRSPVIWAAAVAQASFQVCFLAAVVRSGVATGTLVAIGSAPLLTGLAVTVQTRRPTAGWLASTLVGLLGLVLLVGVGAGLGRSDPLGLLLALGAAASYASYIIAGGGLLRLRQPLDSSLPAVFALAVVLTSPVLVLADWSWAASVDGLLMVGWLALVPTVLAYALFNRGLRHVDAPTAATLGLVEPVVATALAVLVLAESLTTVQWLGAVLIGAAVVLVAWLGVQPPAAAVAGAR